MAEVALEMAAPHAGSAASFGTVLLPRGSARASARAVTLLATALSVLGLVMILSVSTGPETPASDPYRFVRRQAGSLIAAAVLAVVFTRMDYRVLARNSWWILGALWALLLVALAMPEQLGARRWIPIGDLGQLQPSEFTKLAVIIWAAAFAEKRGDRLREFWRGFVPGIAIVGVSSALVLVEPDNGTALFLAAIGGAVLLVNGLRIKHVLPFFHAGIPAVLMFMSSFHR
jgi:cell division protein FtsW